MANHALRSIFRVCVSFCLASALLAALGITVLGENPDPAARPDRGTRPVGSYAISDIEKISLTNGNLNLAIPLAGLPPIAGGKLSWGVSAIYNSKLYDSRANEWEADFFHHANYTRNELQLGGGGWRIGGRYSLSLHLASQDYTPLSTGCTSPPCSNTAYRFKLILTTPDGAQHELRPLGYQSYIGTEAWRTGYYQVTPATLQQTMAYYSFDGSYLWATVQKWGDPVGDPSSINSSPTKWDVYLPDGTRIKQRPGDQWISDTNNNQIHIYTETAGVVSTTHYEDLTATGAVRREILLVHNSSTNTGYVRYQKVDGTTVDIDLNWGVTQPQGLLYNVGDHICSTVAELLDVGDLPVLRSIVLPQTEANAARQQFTFSYNADTTFTQSVQWQPFCAQNLTTDVHSSGWGSLNRMVTPAGAVVDYKYSLDNNPGPGTSHDIKEVLREYVSEKKITHLDGSVDTGTYVISTTSGTMTGPDNGVTTEYFYPHDPALAHSMAGDGKGGLVYKTDRAGKEIVERRWELRQFNGSDGAAPNSVVGFNPVVVAEYTTLVGTPSTTSKMSAKLYDYDYNGNLTRETDYALFNASAVPRDGTAVNLPIGVPTGTPKLREVTTTYYNPATSAGSQNVYAKRDLAAPGVTILNAAQETSVGDGVTQLSNTQLAYDSAPFGSPPAIGNLTEVSQWDDLNPGTRIITTNTYDTYGNLATTTDPNGNIKKFFYEDATHALPTKITINPGTTAPTEQNTTIVYDYYTGLVTSQTDPNGSIATTDYTNQRLTTNPAQPVKDPYGRPGVVIGPAVTSTTGGPNQHHKMVTTYFDSLRQVTVESDLNSEGDRKLKTRSSSDELGRGVLTETSENGSSYTISSKTLYKFNPALKQSITKVSNPSRGDGALTEGWTRTTQDELGRVIEVATFSGPPTTPPPDSGTNANWTGRLISSYNAEQTLVADQAGKKRRSLVDGLGRLQQADELFEDETLYASTTYGYDALNNLIQVSQGPSQTRTLQYTSLSRLKTATNPENGTISYEYYANGNLKKKTDARGVVTQYAYDRMNRLIARSYTGDPQNTPAVNYYYDNQMLPAGAPSVPPGASIGRLLAVLYGGSSSTTGNYQSYDAAGRVTASLQKTDAQVYQTSYGHDLAGNLTSETYPSGKEVRTSFDNAGRLSSLSRYIGGVFDKTYASGFSYTASGAVSALSLSYASGSPVMSEQMTYNSRQQMTKMELRKVVGSSLILGLDYAYGAASSNNGNLSSQGIRVGTNTIATQTYTYDHLNRLSTVSESNSVANWQQAYFYDRYGNRAVSSASDYIPMPRQTPIASSVSNLASIISPTTNRIIATSDYHYDAAGNLDQQPNLTLGFDQMSYNAENRQVSYKKGGATTSYTYDGNGQRVKKRNPDNSEVVFVYNVAGQLIAEYNSSTGSTGQSSQTSYLMADHLGSTRVVTQADGSVKARYDYLPFGEEIGMERRPAGIGYGGNDSTRQKFTGYERDGESNLDFAQTRHHSSSHGRFSSVDPSASVDLLLPQSWNQYTYCLNNPLAFIDPYGLIWLRSSDENPTYKWVDDDKYNKDEWQQQGYSEVATGTVIYLGWVGGNFKQYEDLVGGYVTLGENGVVEAADDPQTDPAFSPWLHLIPDYVSVQFNIAVPNPYTGTLIGWSGQITGDRYGNIYASPLGVSFGKSAFLVSASAEVGYVLQNRTPTPRQLRSFLTGDAYNAGFGYGLAESVTYSPNADGSKWAMQFGIATPQIGVSYNPAFRVGSVSPLFTISPSPGIE